MEKVSRFKGGKTRGGRRRKRCFVEAGDLSPLGLTVHWTRIMDLVLDPGPVRGLDPVKGRPCADMFVGFAAALVL